MEGPMPTIQIASSYTLLAALLSSACDDGARLASHIAAEDVAGVEEPPQRLVWTAPEYPAALRGAEVEGRVTFRFIVDTTGVPEAQSVRILSSPHEELSKAVRAALPSWRYTPA